MYISRPFIYHDNDLSCMSVMISTFYMNVQTVISEYNPFFVVIGLQ